MLDIGRILAHGVLLSVLASLVLISAVTFNPRFALKDLPRDIRESVPPLTRRETVQALIFFLPFMALVIGIPVLSALGLEAHGAADVSFAARFVHILGVLFVFFVVDLVVLDWLIYCTITPNRLVIPGTEGMAGYKDYRHHLRAHARGAVWLAIAALVLAGIVQVLR
ncbi:MAG: hypothetical protein P8Y21_01535 [Gemmatimonadales bacterium]